MIPFVLAIGGVTVKLSDFCRPPRTAVGRRADPESPGRLGNPPKVC
jgi:hypothetical protein